jgi:hypothetical protein
VRWVNDDGRHDGRPLRDDQHSLLGMDLHQWRVFGKPRWKRQTPRTRHETKVKKQNVRIVVPKKDCGRVVHLNCSGLVVNVIDDGWLMGGFCRGDGAITRTSSARPPRPRPTQSQERAAAMAVRSIVADHWPCQKRQHPGQGVSQVSSAVAVQRSLSPGPKGAHTWRRHKCTRDTAGHAAASASVGR